MRIRPRDDADLPACVDLLHAVHAADGYPVNLPPDPASFLAVSGTLGAWVAEGWAGGEGSGGGGGSGAGQGSGGGEVGGVGGESGSARVLGHVLLRSQTSPAVMEKAAAATGLGADRLAVVGRLLVGPAARRSGIGRALLGAAARRAVALGRHPVLDVVRSHVAAVAMYERAGWRRAGEVDVTFPNGRRVEELVFVAPGDPRAVLAATTDRRDVSVVPPLPQTSCAGEGRTGAR